jgi:site-specific recombinase XerD
MEHSTDHGVEPAAEKPGRRPRAYGKGTLYQRGEAWWVQYHVHGRRIRERAEGATSRRAAQEYLNGRLGRAAEGRPLPPRVDKIRYAELAADLRLHYQTTHHRDAKDVERRLRPLDAFFADTRAVDLTEAALTRYVAHRQASTTRRGGPPANGTINRELSLLGTMLRLAARRQKVLRPPTITLLKEAAPRAGFFEPAQFAAVRRRLRPDLQLAVDLAYTYGWRVRDEVLTLARRHVDLEAGSVRLDPGSTKNGEGRVVYLTPALAATVAEQVTRMHALERRLGRVIPWLFAHAADGPHNPKTGTLRYQAGDRVRDFRRAWRTACKLAGCPGMLRHDFRRTAVRNLVNDGTPEKVAMTITGHKTRSVFDRYHIVAPEDLRAATARIAARASTPAARRPRRVRA